MSTPQDLADTLVQVRPREYVRIVADWLSRATEVHTAPALTGDEVVDALVAAAAAHLTFDADGTVPGWTTEPSRRVDRLWYPGPAALFPNALVHSPLSFVARGVLVEEASLVSV